MARRSPRKPRPENEQHGGRSRRAGVWLATLSTVVGVATGMFTLRDQVFPSEAGTAQAVPDSVYRYKVGGICDKLNAAERARARELRPLDRRLRRARTTAEQRNALLDAVRHETARSSHALAALAALDPPKTRAAGHRSTKAAWNRNLDRIRAYAEQLDRASDRRQVIAAIRHLSRQRSAIARDGVRVTTGLQRQAQESCRIEPPITTSTLTLPPLRGTAPGGDSGKGETADAGGGGSAGAGGSSVGTPSAGSGSDAAADTGGPAINTPSPSQPRLTAPDPSSTGGDDGTTENPTTTGGAE